jgi:hypothetical protein
VIGGVAPASPTGLNFHASGDKWSDVESRNALAPGTADDLSGVLPKSDLKGFPRGDCTAMQSLPVTF